MNEKLDYNKYPPSYTRRARAADFHDEVFDEKSKTSQCEYALEYMKKYGSITPLEALNAFNCMRLGARIADLRADGYIIETGNDPYSDKNYAVYRLYEEGVEYDG